MVSGSTGGRFSYANVMSTIAVFGLLAGGGAYAASKIGPNDIAKNAVRSKHVQKKAIKAKQIQAGSVKNALGMIASGPVLIDGGTPSNANERTLARSGPIRLVLHCETDQAHLVLRSNTDGFSNAVQYKTSPILDPELESHGGPFGPGDEGFDGSIAAVAPGFDNDAGVSFIARAGNSTLSGEGQLFPATGNRCGARFNGLAG